MSREYAMHVSILSRSLNRPLGDGRGAQSRTPKAGDLDVSRQGSAPFMRPLRGTSRPIKPLPHMEGNLAEQERLETDMGIRLLKRLVQLRRASCDQSIGRERDPVCYRTANFADEETATRERRTGEASCRTRENAEEEEPSGRVSTTRCCNNAG